MTPQAGVTQEPDADDDSEDKGLFRFMRRKPAKEKRSETEWVDTLRAQADPEEEPEMDSPFMMGEQEPPEEEPEPEPEQPEPEPLEHYRVERQWRRRHQDEMEEIHSYIDRVIGTDRDPLARHRRLSEIGVHRHPTTKRDIASVDVEGLDEELMIAFTFPKEELRSARMVYETEGGYVIEVTRAVGGDEENIERHHYTVSRVGSVAHALDKLRARDVDDRVRREPSGTATHTPAEETGANQEPPSEWSGPQPEEEPPEAPREPPQDVEPEGEREAVDEESPWEEPPAEKGRLGGFASRFKRDKEPTPYTADEPAVEEETPATEPVEEAEEKPKGGLGGFASRFKRDKGDDPDEPDAPEAPSEEGSSEYPGLEDTPEESSRAGRGLGSRFKRRGKESEPEGETDAASQADEAQVGEEGGSKKRGLLGGIPGLKKKRGKDSDDEEE